jgi:hypothetical protein
MMAAHFRTLAAPARAEAFHRIGLPMDCADQVGLALIRPAGDGLFEFDDQGDVAASVHSIFASKIKCCVDQLRSPV